MPRFYLPQTLIPNQTLSLPEALVRHVQVLRAQPDDVIELFDGNGLVYQAIILNMGKKSVSVLIQALHHTSSESTLPITLLQSISSSERMDWVMQKSVELGVAHIVPIITERSSQRPTGERAEKKVARWQEIVIAACEQCGRTQLPTVNPILPFHLGLSNLPTTHSRLLMSLQRSQALNQLAKPQAVALLVGPEGGLSADEETLSIHQFGFMPFRLGPRVLRTETAALAAIAAMQTLWGDFAAQ